MTKLLMSIRLFSLFPTFLRKFGRRMMLIKTAVNMISNESAFFSKAIRDVKIINKNNLIVSFEIIVPFLN